MGAHFLTSENRLFWMLLWLPGVVVADGGFETPIDLQAREVLSPELLSGEFHSVDNRVRNDGYLNYYTVQSDYGEFEAVSTGMLKTRIAELNALAALEDYSKTEVFLKSAADAGVRQIRTIKSFATKPVKTVKGIPRGIGRMFKRFKRKTGDAARATKDFVTRDDESKDASADQDKEEGKDLKKKAAGVTEGAFGVSNAERAWSAKLGTDPYSSNQVLRGAIKELAWADRLGSFGIRFAGIPELPGADIIGTVNHAVWSKDPYELEDLNRARLASSGADDSLIEAYLKNPNMSPSAKTLMAASIAELDGVAGRDGILRQSLNAQTEAEVGFLLSSTTMLVWYHINREPIAKVLTYAAIPAGITQNGTAVLTFAVDHVYWTETIAQAASNHETRISESGDISKEIWFKGSASDRTKSGLLELGFALHENVSVLMAAPAD